MTLQIADRNSRKHDQSFQQYATELLHIYLLDIGE